MSKDHTVPAGIIANFSDNLLPKSRESRLFHINDKSPRGVVEEAAEKFFYSNNEYNIDLPGIDSKALDKSWSEYESKFINLSRNIDCIENINKEEHLLLTRYCSNSIIRDPDYRNYISEKTGLPPKLSKNSAQMNRINHMSDYFYLFYNYHISIIHAEPGSNFIINDRGYAILKASDDHSALIYIYEIFKDSKLIGEITPTSFIFPISKKICIKLTPRIKWAMNPNKIHLLHLSLQKKHVDELNKIISSQRRLEIAGNSKDIVTQYHSPIKLSLKDFTALLGMTLLSPGESIIKSSCSGQNGSTEKFQVEKNSKIFRKIADCEKSGMTIVQSTLRSVLQGHRFYPDLLHLSHLV